jgi:hypothetical protein
MLYIEKNIIQSIALFMPKSDVRYYLNGVHVKVNNDRFIIEASDGHSLAFSVGKIVIEPCDSFEVIIPCDTIQAVLKLKPNYKSELIGISINSIGYSNSMLSYASIDGKFPDIQRVYANTKEDYSNLALKINPDYYYRISQIMKFQKIELFNVWHLADKMVFNAGEVSGLIMPMRELEKGSVPQYEVI